MTHLLSPLRLTVFALPFFMGGCGMYDWANTHMPVIGDRCENWQCFTQSGQEQSRLHEQERLHPVQNPDSTATAAAPAVTPVPAPSASSTPAMPLAPPAGPEGAYKYEPRAPGPAEASPF